MKRFDFESIAQIPNALVRHEALDKEIARVGDDLLLTDCLMWREKGGAYVLKRLDELTADGRAPTYRLRVLRDEWGEPVEPGTTIEWMFKQRTRDSHGRKILRRDVNAAIRRGEGRMYEDWHSATVDDDGCIAVPYKDAALLLDKHGVHFESQQPITGLREFATAPRYFTPMGNGALRALKTEADRENTIKRGGKIVEKLRHNWLYEEVPPQHDPPVRRGRKGKAKANPAGGEE